MSEFHAAVASVLLGLGVGMTMVGRSWPQRGQHRARRRPVQVEVPAYRLVPARQLAACCPGCGRQITIHTTTGAAS